MPKESISIAYADTGKGPEWSESYMSESLKGLGFDTELFDVLGPGSPRGECILNRVYPSLSDGNGVADMVIELSEDMEAASRRVINSAHSAVFDYDKFEAYKRLREAGVPTPETHLVEGFGPAMEACESLGYPVVMKRSTGGKSIGIKMLRDPEEAEREIRGFLSNGNGYQGEMLLQKFIKSQRNHDVRIGVIGGEPQISYGRTLISLNGEEPWIACIAMGSESIEEYKASKNEEDIAVRSTLALGAEISEVDLCIGPDGPTVIENNLTSTYFTTDIEKIEKVIRYVTGQLK